MVPTQSSRELPRSVYVCEVERQGDLLQSASSRMAEWLIDKCPACPYEVYMAALEARGAVDRWTETRCRRPKGASS